MFDFHVRSHVKEIATCSNFMKVNHVLIKKRCFGVPTVAQRLADPTTSNAGSIPGLTQWVKDPALLWLWRRLAAVAPIEPLAWEPPRTTDATLKTKKQK